MRTQRNTRTTVSAAMLSAVAYPLAFIGIQLPLSPSFGKMDVSDLPALAAALSTHSNKAGYGAVECDPIQSFEGLLDPRRYHADL